MGRLEIDTYNYDVKVDDMKSVIRALLQAFLPTGRAEMNMTKEQVKAVKRARAALTY